MTTARRSLSDILRNGSSLQELEGLYKEIQAAPEFGPVPRGEFNCRVVNGELFNARTTGTPGYKLTLEITDGQYAGRRLYHNFWLTRAALPGVKRDLPKLAMTELSELQGPPPVGILLRCKVSLRTNDQGLQFNKIDGFAAAGREPDDPYAPANNSGPAADAGASQGPPDTSSTLGAAPAVGVDDQNGPANRRKPATRPRRESTARRKRTARGDSSGPSKKGT